MRLGVNRVFITEKYLNLLTEGFKWKVYCDMDGVLTNFNHEADSLWPGVRLNMDHTKLWSNIEEVGPSWWANLPWMPDGKVLWNYIKPYNPMILTAVPKAEYGSSGYTARDGKVRWITRELGDPFIRTAVITTADRKHHYAIPNSILIDDTKLNVDRFTKAGGIGILHISAQDTITQLKNLMQ